MLVDIKKAVSILKSGGIIAHPTEAVFGFACDPYNAAAIDRLLTIKNRKIGKGFILVASDWEQIKGMCAAVEDEKLQSALASWPGPYTWVFLASQHVPEWMGERIALRVSDHPIVQALCQEFGGPLISTSANREGEPPLRQYQDVVENFSNSVDFIVPGEVGGLDKPTEIRDVESGILLR